MSPLDELEKVVGARNGLHGDAGGAGDTRNLWGSDRESHYVTANPAVGGGLGL